MPSGTGGFVSYVSVTLYLSHNEEDIAAWVEENGPVNLAFNMVAVQVIQFLY